MTLIRGKYLYASPAEIAWFVLDLAAHRGGAVHVFVAPSGELTVGRCSTTPAHATRRTYTADQGEAAIAADLVATHRGLAARAYPSRGLAAFQQELRP
jgi:hypothetical protein